MRCALLNSLGNAESLILSLRINLAPEQPTVCQEKNSCCLFKEKIIWTYQRKVMGRMTRNASTDTTRYFLTMCFFPYTPSVEVPGLDNTTGEISYDKILLSLQKYRKLRKKQNQDTCQHLSASKHA